jgi:hypothetical protein
MARDLIPPPSPAGRPTTPDGTPNLIELPPEPVTEADAPKGPPPGPSQFRNRFGFLLGALGGVFIATALVLVVMITTNGNNPDDAILAPNWSKWQPSNTDDINAGAAQIAEHVGAEYKHPNGQQLLLVEGQKLPVRVLLQPASGSIAKYDGPGVVYQLNGLGPNGSIKDGKPSEKRLKLIHREALELALYTFRYLPDVEMVVALLPPPPPTAEETAAASAGLATTNPNAKTAVFYRPGDLKAQLQVPLGHTLSAKAPNPDTIGGRELKTVELLTQSNIFKWSLQQSDLVLTR